MTTLEGHVVDGVIVLEPPIRLPEGTQVRVSLVESASTGSEENRSEPSLAERLLRHAGKAHDLPSDFARCHDHYIHGTPRE